MARLLMLALAYMLVFTQVFSITLGDYEYHGEWLSKSDMPKPRSDFSATLMRGKIYLVGGCSGEKQYRTSPSEGYYCTQVEKSVDVFDPASDSYTTGIELPQPRWRHAAATYNDKLYVFGGRSIDEDLLNDMDVFDFRKQTWTVIPVPHKRSDHTAVQFYGKILFFGGFDANFQALTSVLAYDPETDTFDDTSYPPMKHARGDAAAVVMKGEIYVAGGFSRTSNTAFTDVVEVFTPSVHAWTTIKSMTSRRGDQVAGVVNGRLHVVGGENALLSGGPVLEADVYDPELDLWQVLEVVPDQARSRFAGCVVGSELIVFGGQGTVNGELNKPGSSYSIGKQVESYLETATIEDSHMKFDDHMTVVSGLSVTAIIVTFAVLFLSIVTYKDYKRELRHRGSSRTRPESSFEMSAITQAQNDDLHPADTALEDDDDEEAATEPLEDFSEA